MSAALTTTTQQPLAYGELERLADSIAKSGLFGIKTKEQAVVLMMISYAEGRHPVEAARDYDIIQGRPAKKAEAMMRDFIRAGGKVEWHALSDEIADATFTHPQTGVVRIDWTMARATTAGLAGKDNWKKTPRAMLRSRVVSEGIRTLWPLATSGMYETGEVSDMKPANDIEHNGTTIDAEPEAPSARDRINSEIPLRAAATAMPRAPTVRAPAPTEQPGNGRRTVGQFLAGLRIAGQDALKEPNPAEAVDRLVCGEEVLRMKGYLKDAPLAELNAIITELLIEVTPKAPPDASDPVSDTAEELPEIVGEQRVHAG